VERGGVTREPDDERRQCEKREIGRCERERVRFLRIRIRIRCVVHENIADDGVVLGGLIQEEPLREVIIGLRRTGEIGLRQGAAVVGDCDPDEVVVLDQIPGNHRIVYAREEDPLTWGEEPKDGPRPGAVRQVVVVDPVVVEVDAFGATPIAKDVRQEQDGGTDRVVSHLVVNDQDVVAVRDLDAVGALFHDVALDQDVLGSLDPECAIFRGTRGVAVADDAVLR